MRHSLGLILSLVLISSFSFALFDADPTQAQIIIDNDPEPVEGKSKPFVDYTVQSGDSLWLISQHFNVPVDQLRRINLILPGRSIFPGQVLIIPASAVDRRSSPLPFVSLESDGDRSPGAQPSGAMTLQSPLPLDSLFMSQGYHPYHHGLDYSLEEGTPIWSIAHGEVIRVDRDHLIYGQMVIVDHGNGITSLYAHLSDVWVRTGYIVLQGETLGLSGNTGRSSNPHLHFELRVDGERINPCEHMPICP